MHSDIGLTCIKVPLCVHERLQLKQSHRLGITNEGSYSILESDTTKSVSIVEDINNHSYYKVGDILQVFRLPLTPEFAVGIHSLGK